MTNFGRQAHLDGRGWFETLANAIDRANPHDVFARIGFDRDAVTGEPAPADLFHDDIEKLRASQEFRDYKAAA
jgi:hypothetical protein